MKKLTLFAVLILFVSPVLFPVADAKAQTSLGLGTNLNVGTNLNAGANLNAAANGNTANVHLGLKLRNPVARLALSGAITGSLTLQQPPEVVPGVEPPPSPVFGILVFIPGTSLMAMTNVNGEFTISNVPAGTYSLAIQVSGTVPIVVQEDVTVKAKLLTDLDPILLPILTPIQPAPQPAP